MIRYSMEDYIRVRMTTEEKERWQREAQARGITLSKMVRDVVGASIAKARKITDKDGRGAPEVIEKGLPRQKIGGMVTYFK